MDDKLRYHIEREQALEALKALGLESLPLHVAARFMPDLPEWQKYRLRRKRRTSPPKAVR